MYKFDAKKTKEEAVQFIKNWFDENGKDCKAVIGVSGGKDSSVVAGLCVEALGKDRVVGVLMPFGNQSDIDDAYDLCDFLDIKRYVVPIHMAVNRVIEAIEHSFGINEQALINLQARTRMVTLYAVAQSLSGRVVATGNFSEYMLGWFSRWDCSVGDVAPILNLTCTEVKAIGEELGLPEYLIEKVPVDGLTAKTDEEHFGFTYEVLDRYLREGVIDNIDTQVKIETMIQNSEFKRLPIPSYQPDFVD